MARGKYKAARQEPAGADDTYEDDDGDGGYENPNAKYDAAHTQYEDPDAKYDAQDEDEEDGANLDDEYDAEAEDNDDVSDYDDDSDAEDYDDDSDADDDDDNSQDENATPYVAPTALAAMRQAFKPRSHRQKTQPATGTAEDAARVIYIDRRERRICYFLIGLLVFAAVVYYVSLHKFVDKTDLKLQNEYRDHAVPDALYLGAATVGLAAATLTKRRALIGFVLLFGGFAISLIVGPFAVIYLGTGLWLIFRAFRKTPPKPRPTLAEQRADSRDAAAARRERTSTGAAARNRPATRPTTASANRPLARNGRLPANSNRNGPPPSKRYTPPKQVKRPAPVVAPEPEPSNRLSAWLRK